MGMRNGKDLIVVQTRAGVGTELRMCGVTGVVGEMASFEKIPSTPRPPARNTEYLSSRTRRRPWAPCFVSALLDKQDHNDAALMMLMMTGGQRSQHIINTYRKTQKPSRSRSTG